MFLGNSIVCKELQSEKAYSPTSLNELGKYTCFRLRQFPNAFASIVSSVSGNVSSLKHIHCLKADSPILLIDSVVYPHHPSPLKDILDRFEHPSKAYPSFVGILNDVNLFAEY